MLASFGMSHVRGEYYELAYDGWGRAVDARAVEYSDTQFGAGGGVGWRIPLTEHSALRLLTQYSSWRETELFDSQTIFSLVVGISVLL